jgi:hypothetical protein
VELRDYNGTGHWSRDGIAARYRQYCRALGVPELTDLSPMEHTEGQVRWVYPVMDLVITGIEAGDRACIALGLDFIEEDQRFTFGRILKSNTARALRRAKLDEAQKERVRARVIAMLVQGNVPHEFKQYAKLLRHVGAGDRWFQVEGRLSRENPYVMRWFEYFRAAFGR